MMKNCERLFLTGMGAAAAGPTDGHAPEMEDAQHAHKSQILRVVRRSLGFIDPRLVDHGERVAYIACAIARAAGGLGIEPDKLLILCLLHDIGAYKTEEIDNMVAFETGDVTAHALYGYVFIHNTTALGAYAEAILHHHTDYSRLGGLDTPEKTVAALIFLADRIDILLLTWQRDGWEALEKLSGSAFAPDLVASFFAAEKRFDVSGHILDGSYRRAIDEWIDDVSLAQDEVEGYLKMLVYSIDFRSPFTVTHTANTMAISKALAELFHMDDARRQAMILGAFLHDIGKIAIPCSILENPGKLDAAQMERMRTHVSVSEEILDGIVSDAVCDIAVRHHEKLNGSGYPRGLTAPQLSLAQRIVAVSDILSALISRRSYKEPFPKEKTIAILAGMRDAGELCPRVCDMLIEHYDYIIHAVDQEDDPVIRLYEKIKGEYLHIRDAWLAARVPCAGAPDQT